MSDQIDATMLSDWRINYGLDTRTPAEAMRWWYDRMDGKAPAGAVAALGLCIDEIDRLRAERDDNAWWRKELADKLHDRETQIRNAWAALRAAGVQSETNLADAIALLAKEQT